ncbi:DUF4010 domain-containing protein [Granulicella mallensis]|uniref:Uncharacterized membrane protein (DUF4010 family) n=1 Tax=Granulicella mallensis TaxID=940614 RepID=A0A7W7ZMS7_9BACT|nr:DUF4010 domain-containing protein [Granulicella mallensis]MBB5062826.1 uncharacterized membrane protein (DUF4010 family) [Granulicella mallensis]
MHSWIERLHASSAEFPPLVTAVKLGVALAIGLLIGFERQWSHKDFGVRTFSLAALIGGLTAMMPMPVLITGMVGVLILAALLNLRDILASQSVEGTTSAALILTFVLGALSGEGHIFTATACGIVTTWLLSLKPQFRAFAGGVKPEEIRSALMLGLFGFVVWPLLPNRYIDPWELLQPRDAWVTILVVACIGFVNYILLRVYGKRGVALTAVLGGMVNSTAATAEFAETLPASGLLSQTVVAVLLTSVAMFARNLLLLAIFAHDAVPFAMAPMLTMTAIAGFFVWRRHRPRDEEQEMDLNLPSPVSFAKVFRMGGLFILIQVIGTAATRWLGNAGLLAVSMVGGTV